MNDISILVISLLFIAVGMTGLLGDGLADRERSNARRVLFGWCRCLRLPDIGIGE